MQGGQAYETGMLNFHNNYALNEEIGGMPERDFTVEMWVRTPAYKATAENVQRSELFSYATHSTVGGAGAPSCKLLLSSACYACLTALNMVAGQLVA